MINKKVKAQITVYASLSIFLVITLVCMCIRSAAVAADYVTAQLGLELSTEAVFAGYKSNLLEEFDIFALYKNDSLEPLFLQYLNKNADNLQIQAVSGELNDYIYMTDNNGECINQEILSFMKYGIYEDIFLQQQEMKTQKKQSEALNEITEEIGKCEKVFCEQEEVLLGIIQRVKAIDVDKALQLTEDLKEDVMIYEEAVDKQENDTQEIQSFYKINKEALEAECLRLEEMFTDIIKQFAEYEDKSEKVRQQVKICRSKAEQKKEVLSEQLYAGIMEDTEIFEREAASYELCDVSAIRAGVKKRAEEAAVLKTYINDMADEITEENYIELTKQLKKIKTDTESLECRQLVDENCRMDLSEKKEGLKNIRQTAEKLKSGIMELVTGQEQISEKQLTCEDLADTLIGKNSDSKGETLKNQVLYNEYLLMKFPSYTDYLDTDKKLCTETGKQLDYMLEYILYGKESDKENLQQSIVELSLFREGVNMAYLLTDSSKKAEAYSLAAALTGVSQNMAVIKAAQYVILGVWAYAESILELKQMYRGNKTEIIKNGENWQLSLKQLLSLDLTGGEASEKGVTYEDYLRTFFLLQNTQQKYYRTMAAIEVRMTELGDTGFRMQNYIYGCKSSALYKIGILQQYYERNTSYHY